MHGKISLTLDDYSSIKDYGFGKVVLDLPCGAAARTAAMSFRSSHHNEKMSILRLPAAPAVNSSLKELELKHIRLEGGSLSDIVSSCALLRRLLIHFVWGMDGQDLTISNQLLEELDVDCIFGRLGRLEVSCPKLRSLRIYRLLGLWPDCKMVARFCTPCLEEISWPSCPSLPKSRVEFLGSLDTVRRLSVALLTHGQTYEPHLGAWLLRSCTGVHRLDVSLWNTTRNDADNDVMNLMEGLPKLSSVTHLRVATKNWRHMFGASIAELLSRCCQLQRLDVCADNHSRSDTCPAECPCKRPLEWKHRRLSLDFLEHVEIYYKKHWVDWIIDLNILLRLSSKANVKMHA